MRQDSRAVAGRCRNFRLFLAVLGIFLLVRPAGADPCCLAGTCEDRAPSDCLAAGGISGYCLPGQACGSDSCDPTRISEITGLAVSRTGPDALRLVWSPDPFANNYAVRFVTYRDALADLRRWGMGTGVPGADPSTVPEALHPGALTGNPGAISYYQVLGKCRDPGLAPAACCDAAGACSEPVFQDDCLLGGGVFVGPGSRCETDPCEPRMAACLAVAGNVLHFDGDPGDYIHPGTDTITDAVFTSLIQPLDAPDWIEVDVNPNDPSQGGIWSCYYSTRAFGTVLAPGFYPDAQRAGFEDPGHPGLDIRGDGRGCSTLQGEFRIHALLVEGGKLRYLSASWEQWCGSSSPASMRGCVRYER